MNKTVSRKARRGNEDSGAKAVEALTPELLRARRDQLVQTHNNLTQEIGRANEQLLAIRGAVGLLDELLKNSETTTDVDPN